MLKHSIPTRNTRRALRDSGHLLLAILLMMALLAISLTYVAPRAVQQMKRDREEEMIHRGTEYARAIKKFYKKFGNYPTSMEQLENTNNIRFLRKRYKDPLTKDGKWTLLHYTDVAGLLVGATGGPGTPAAALAAQGLQTPGSPANSAFGGAGASNPGGLGTSGFGAGNSQSALGGQSSGFSLSIQQGQLGSAQQTTSGSALGGASGTGTGSGTGTSSTGTSSTGGGNSGTGSTDNSSSGNNANASTTALGAQSANNQTFGAGGIVGVASKSKDPTIRIYNKKKTYDEWVFIYSPTMDQANVLLKGPYSPSAFVGGSNIGTPAGQQNQNQQSPFGQPSGGSGAQQPGGFNNQTLTPGGQQYPPDQSH